MKGQDVLLLLVVGIVGIGAYRTYKVRQEEISMIGGGTIKLGEYDDAFQRAREDGDTTFIEDPYLREQITYDLHEIRKSEDMGSTVPNFGSGTPAKPPVYNGYGEVHASLTAPKKKLSKGDGYRARVKYNLWLEPFSTGYNWRMIASGMMPTKQITSGRSDTPTHAGEVMANLEMPSGKVDAKIFIALQMYLQGQWKEVGRDHLRVLRAGAESASDAKDIIPVIPADTVDPYGKNVPWIEPVPPSGDPSGGLIQYLTEEEQLKALEEKEG